MRLYNEHLLKQVVPK